MSNNFIDLIYAKNKGVQDVKGEHSDAIIFGGDGSLVIKSEGGEFEKTVIPIDPKFTDTIDSPDTVIDKILIGVQDADNARKLEIFSGLQGKLGHQGTQGIQGDQGAKGTQGIQGNPGAQGDKGVNGPNGAQGDKGIQGDPGVQGAPGTGINLTESNGILKYKNNTIITEQNYGAYIDYGVNISTTNSTNPVYVTGFDSTSGRARTLDINTNVYWKQESSSANATAYLYTSSDLNLKENLQPISKEFIDKVYNSIDLIYDFNWKNDPNDKTTGFIAQYLEELDPYLVNTNEEGIKAVNYNGALSKMVGVLLKKTKEQDQRINELENVIRKLLGTSI